MTHGCGQATSESRRRGRPPLVPNGAAAAHVHVRIGPDLYDALYRRAEIERVSVPEMIRRAAARLVLPAAPENLGT